MLAETSKQMRPPPRGEALAGKPVIWYRRVTASEVVMCLLMAAYGAAFYSGISQYWFHPGWTTDDALQQVYPFHEVLHPQIFKDDITTEVMKGYLAPAHYYLCYAITWLVGDPIMMSHWVMLIQVILTLSLLFAAVRCAAGTVPAFFAVTWLLHSRNLMQRITGGLPRGWAPPIFCAFLFFALSGRHRAVLVTIFLGCLLNPPATLVVAGAYGLLLIWRVATARGDEVASAKRRLIELFICSPIFALTTLGVVNRPESVGQMVTFSEASRMADFASGGRFPFLPFKPAISEIRTFGLEAFVARFYDPPEFVRSAMPFVVLGGLVMLGARGRRRRRTTLPAEIVLLGVSALSVYFLSRVFAFKLYVPNRHLQIPLAVFFVSIFSIGLWRAFHRGEPGRWADSRWSVAWPSALALVVCGSIVFVGSSLGLVGTLNFNYSADKKGWMFAWLRSNTPESSFIAGHPTHLDGVQLFAVRRGYVTTETTHPFYTGYYAEMRRRNEISLRAHYSGSLRELVDILEPEGITHFIFRRDDFYPGALQKTKFFASYKDLLTPLLSRPEEDYAYRQLPVSVDMERYPFMPFKDHYSTIIDVKALKGFLEKNPSWSGREEKK